VLLRSTMLIPALGLAVAACATKATQVASTTTSNAKMNASAAVALGIPPAHLPPPGECRVWVPGVPPDKQQRTRSCTGVVRAAPANSRILFRPTKDAGMVHVREMDRAPEGSMIVVRVYDAKDGRYLRDERQHLRESFDREERPQQEPGGEPSARGRGQRQT
jgi:hypothetical protein